MAYEDDLKTAKPEEGAIGEDIAARNAKADELLLRLQRRIDERDAPRAEPAPRREDCKPEEGYRREAEYGMGEEPYAFGIEMNPQEPPYGEYVYDDAFFEGEPQYTEAPEFSYTGGGIFGLDIPSGGSYAPPRSDGGSSGRTYFTEHEIRGEDEYLDLLDDDTPEHIVRVSGGPPPRGIGYYKSEHYIERKEPKEVPTLFTDDEIDELAREYKPIYVPAGTAPRKPRDADADSFFGDIPELYGDELDEAYGDELTDKYSEREPREYFEDYEGGGDKELIPEEAYLGSEGAEDDEYDGSVFDEPELGKKSRRADDELSPEEEAFLKELLREEKSKGEPRTAQAEDYERFGELDGYENASDEPSFGYDMRPDGKGEEHYTPYVDENDERYLEEYESSLGERAVGEREPGAEDDRFFLEEELRREEDVGVAAYDKYSLGIFLKETDRRVAALKHQLKEKEKRGSALADNIELTVDRLNILKAIVDERAAALSAVVRSGYRSHLKHTRKLLLLAIGEYNIAVTEYENITGHSLAFASSSIPQDIIAGRPYQKLPNISYINEDYPESEYLPEKMSRSERRAFKREQMKLARESAAEEQRLRRMSGGKSSAAREQEGNIADVASDIDRAVLMVESRIDAGITEYEKRRDMAEYTYSVKNSDKRLEISRCSAEIRRLTKKRSAARRAERDDSERYYSALLTPPDGVFLKKRAKRDKLESLYMKLEGLLLERERIDEQLIKLYQASGVKKSDTGRRLTRQRRKTAKKIKRCFRRDMKILDEKIPLDVKEKIVKCCNKIIATEVEITDLRYRIKHSRPKGAALYELRGKIKEDKSALKRYLSDYRYQLKRGKKYVERRRGSLVQILWVLGSLAVIGIGVVLYFLLR